MLPLSPRVSPASNTGYSDENGESNGSPQALDARGQSKRIQELIGQIEASPDARARELLYECMQSLLALYGGGLERILQLARNGGVEGQKILEALVHDKLVSGLLLIHGLHPLSLKERLLGALDKIRPYLQSHGGNVELISVDEVAARLRLQGDLQELPLFLGHLGTGRPAGDRGRLSPTCWISKWKAWRLLRRRILAGTAHDDDPLRRGFELSRRRRGGARCEWKGRALWSATSEVICTRTESLPRVPRHAERGKPRWRGFVLPVWTPL